MTMIDTITASQPQALRQVSVEVIFFGLPALRAGILALQAKGLQARFLPGRYDDCPDEGHNTAWVLAWGMTRLSPSEFIPYVQGIVGKGAIADYAGEVDDIELQAQLKSRTEDQ